MFVNHRRLKLAALTALIVTSIGVGIWWNSPARTTSAPKNATIVLGSETTATNLDTLFMNTRLPGTFRIKSSLENTANPIVGQYLAASKNSRLSNQVGITIGKLQDETIDSISPVRLRLLSPDQYQQTSFSFAPTGSVSFSATNTYEKSVFWVHGDLYAAVVVSGTGDQTSELDSTLSEVVTSWQWR